MIDSVTQEWTQGPADEHAVSVGCRFDLAAALRVRQFMEKFLYLPPTQGEADRIQRDGDDPTKAQPFRLLDWQWKKVVGPLFGWKRPNGRRRFSRGYLSTAKKNGKTGLASGITLYMMLGDGKQRAKTYSVAGTKEQAGLVYGDCTAMVDASPQLGRVIRRIDTKKLLLASNDSTYETLASDAKNNEGYRPHLVIYDELHAAKSRKLFDSMRYGGASERNSLLLTTTTAGDGADPLHICREEYDFAQLVIGGHVKQPDFFACIFEAPKECEIDDVEAIELSNPSLGETLRLDEILSAADEAKASPAKIASFRRYRLNQWVSNAQAWLTDGMWDACPGTIKESDLAGRTCIGGLDLSSTDDLTVFVRVFEPDNHRSEWPVLATFFLPAENVQRLEQQHRVPYSAWVKEGWIKTHPGNVVDYAEVRKAIGELNLVTPIKQIGIDRGWQGQSLESNLIADGFDVVMVGQGWKSQSQPLKELEKIVKSKRLNHGGNPVLRWNALNTVVKVDDSGNYSLTKRMSKAKIDGIAATTNAMHCIAFTPDDESSVYESRGVMTL